MDPTPEVLPAASYSVSPPTRGWTHGVTDASTPPAGFPAHAGMDRNVGVAANGGAWFPRPRGDGPIRGLRTAVTQTVSPPTRGWTRNTLIGHRCPSGFPAHAGMDPHDVLRSYMFSGFPRPRGDGPSKRRHFPLRPLVSPPTRGWTRLPFQRHHGAPGFPAHAGMDPPGSTATPTLTRFPRPRGDGPRSPGTGDRTPAVSPPTRGWTPVRQTISVLMIGFPAHAGMDPGTGYLATAAGRFPRPRGDGPVMTCAVTNVTGFPAHAGMDRKSRSSPTVRSRFPRPRGDGPVNLVIVEGVVTVSPPTRGWTAYARGIIPNPKRVSPPTRGWTRDACGAVSYHSGFPAHAGMDPHRRTAAPCRSWFPRPRGDGPRWYQPSIRVTRVSPPTRGWTPDVP